MAEDYYKTLEISRTASTEQINKAYRNMARKLHPDMNPDDPTAKGKFQKLQEAYDVLGNPEKRKFYDQFGADPNAGPQGPQGPGSWETTGNWPGGGSFQWSSGGRTDGSSGNPSMDDILHMFRGGHGGQANDAAADQFAEEMFGTRTGGGGRRGRRRTTAAPIQGDDIQHSISIPFITAVTGGKIDMVRTIGNKKDTLTVNIPVGVQNGKKIRLRGQGRAGSGGGPNGDLLLEVHIQEHPFFTRIGNDLHLRLPVTLQEAVFGATVDVPTPKGTGKLKIPPDSTSGKKLRMAGCGVHSTGTDKGGDLIVELSVALPTLWTATEKETLRTLTSQPMPAPRTGLRW